MPHDPKSPYCPDGPPEHCHPKPKPFKLEAVIVCTGYDDFLQETLPHNKQMFNKVVVVTSPEDKRTQRVCEFNHVECVVTDKLETRWKKFCKGAGINEGLARLDKDAWVLHLDADIWLPPLTRIMLEQANLDPCMIYGTDRFIVPTYEAWRNFIECPRLQHENKGWVHMDAFKLGTRVLAVDGWIPLGFFQLFNPLGSGINKYPEGHTDAGREDGLFARLWDRAKRHLLPEVTGYHLESEPAAMGINWDGRKTKRFAHGE
jgi:hypothetical protein